LSHRTLERLFLRYRQKGCPRALGRVFDASAPHLLRVAGHLAGNRGEVEDLLQETFLAAIENADGWDEDRPLLPWLFGILANQARRSRRRTLRSPDPERLPRRAPAPPPEELAQSELRQAVEQALAGLAEPYRRVLTLYLGEGLGAKGVASRLACSPSTVRTQIRRGLARLRKSLPVGAAPAVIALPRESLEGIRQVVLSEATTRTGLTASVKGGSMYLDSLLKPWIIPGTLVTVLVVGLFIGLRGDPSSAPPEENLGLNGEPRTAPLADTVPPSDDQEPVRAEVEVAEATEETSGIERLPHRRVLVQVLDRATGEPLPGAELSWWSQNLALGGLLPWPSGAERVDEFAGSWRVVTTNLEDYLGEYGPVLRADANGLVEVPFVAGDTYLRARSGSLLGQDMIGLASDHQVGAPGGTPMRMELVATCRFRVRVVSADGRPLAGVPVAALTDGNVVSWFGETKGAEGLAEITLALDPRLEPEEEATATVVPAILGEAEACTVDLRHPPEEALVLTLPPTGALEARIVDARGQPNRDRVSVSVAHDDGPGADPLVTWLNVEASGDRVHLPYVALDQDLECELWRVPNARRLTGPRFLVRGPVEPGEVVHARLHLPEASPTLRGRIVYDEGRPATDSWFWVRNGFPTPWLRTDSEGAFTWRQSDGALGSGDIGGPVRRLEVTRWESTDVWGSPRGATAAVELPAALPAGGLDVGVLELSRLKRLVAGTVRDPGGSGIACAVVEAKWAPGPAGTCAEVVATDANGRFEIRGSGTGPLFVEASKEGWCFLADERCRVGDERVQLVLHRFGALRLRLLYDQALDPSWFRVSLRREGAESPAAGERSLLDEYEHLEPGTYSLTVKIHDLVVAEEIDIEVRAGAPTEDPRLMPLDLTGQIEAMSVRAMCPDGRSVDALDAVALDERGAFDYDTTCWKSGDGGYLIPLRTDTPAVRLYVTDCRSVEVAFAETESAITFEPGLTVLVASPHVPENITVRPRLSLVGGGDEEARTGTTSGGLSYVVMEPGRENRSPWSSGRVSSPEPVDGGWRFVVPEPGRYRLKWSVVKTIGKRSEKGTLNPEEPAYITVEDQPGEQWFEPVVRPGDLERPLGPL